MTNPPNIPTGPVETMPRGFVPDAEQREQLLAVLAAAGVELGEYDQLMVDWLASYDWSTFATIASWVQRAAAGRDHAIEHRDHWHASYLSAGARVDELENERRSNT